MNTTSTSTHNSSCGGGPDTAVARAEAGTGGWEEAVRLQRWADPDHTDFYVLAGEMVATLQSLEDLAQVLGRQVAGYPHMQQERGRRLYDDTRQVDPAERITDAVTALAALTGHLRAAQAPANRFFSAIGHIGLEDDDADDPDTAVPGTERTDGRPSDGGEVSR